MMEAKISRNTKETRIELLLSNDKRERSLDIGCGFLSHMLDLLCHRAALGVSIKARGDIEVDYHHLSEDIGIAMGQALRKIAGAAPIRRSAPRSCRWMVRSRVWRWTSAAAAASGGGVNFPPRGAAILIWNWFPSSLPVLRARRG